MSSLRITAEPDAVHVSESLTVKPKSEVQTKTRNPVCRAIQRVKTEAQKWKPKPETPCVQGDQVPPQSSSCLLIQCNLSESLKFKPETPCVQAIKSSQNQKFKPKQKSRVQGDQFPRRVHCTTADPSTLTLKV
jgi:hypothetical protein